MLFILFLFVVIIGGGLYYGRAQIKVYILDLIVKHLNMKAEAGLSVAKEELGHLRIDYLHGGVQHTVFLVRDRRAGRGSSTELKLVPIEGETFTIRHPMGYAFPTTPSQLGLSSVTRLGVLGEEKAIFTEDQRVV